MSDITSVQENKINIWLIFFRIVFTGVTIAVIFFIFANSAEIAKISSSKSQAVTLYLNKILQALSINITLTEIFVRKLAHVAEYCLLGFWLMLTLRVYTKRFIAFSSWPLLCGLMIAVADEFLQKFTSGRSSQVTDVCIDFFGVSTGVVIAVMIIMMFTIVIKYKKYNSVK